MDKQIIFSLVTLLTLGIFGYSISRIISFFKLTRESFAVGQVGKRIMLTLLVAFGQTKILRKPLIGMVHAIVYWGFLVITIGTLEMVIDGLLNTERVFGSAGFFYSIITASGDIFAVLIILACIIFLVRRHILRVKRFGGIEMTKGSSIDATIALTLIGLLMISLIGTNVGYLNITNTAVSGYFPISGLLVNSFSEFEPETMEIFYETSWWAHVLLVYIFANILPYSKHFHVFMSVPNVFLSRLGPLTKIDNLEEITKEVKMMLNPDTAFANPPEGETTPPSRFGVKDVNDASWKNYLDALTCTECGRCTAVCPANITGKKLSPRKIFVDFRKRMNEVGPGLVKNGASFTDNKSLIGDYVTAEELWACTTCNACSQECPVNIDHPSLIIDMRRYLVLEESSAPAQINSMFANIENNGAPWPIAQTERMNWAEDIYTDTE